MNNERRTLEEIEYGNNSFVIGKILGYQEVICEDLLNGKAERKYGTRNVEEGRVLTTYCTPDKYADFTKVVNMYYPGLCEFNCIYEGGTLIKM